MKNRCLILFVFVCNMLISCNNRTETNSDYAVRSIYEDNKTIIDIPDDVFDRTLDLNRLFKGFNYVCLETTNECIIGHIDKVITTKDDYIILDKNSDKIFRFNREGRFLNSIGTKGSGPQEYLETYDVSLCNIDEIAILDLKGRKIIIHKLDGSFVREEPMKFLFNQFEFIGNNMICNVYKSFNTLLPVLNKYKIAFADSLSEMTGMSLAYTRNDANTYATIRPLRNFDGKVYFNDPFHNRIFLINSSGIYKEYEIRYKDNVWDKEIDFDKIDDQRFRQIIKDKKYLDGGYVISDDCVFFSIVQKGQRADVYYSTKSKNIIYGSSFTNDKNIMQMLAYRPPQALNPDQSFVAVVDPFQLLQLKDYILKEGIEDFSEYERNIISGITDMDNPILLIYQLNEF